VYKEVHLPNKATRFGRHRGIAWPTHADLLPAIRRRPVLHPQEPPALVSAHVAWDGGATGNPEPGNRSR